ncbi:MAG: hypothetical protein GY770_22645 [Aestuariibacter sp.]|nr:hypothetical protein [Aestuariibacter sp.]
MTITHPNRKDVTYHLHQGTTKKGKPRYYFSKKQPAAPVNEIPDGYEINEIPNGQVFLRKTQPKLITDQERAVVKKALRKRPYLGAIVEVKKNRIVIHIDTPMMRFTLVDKKERTFIVERFNFRGSIDDWMFLDGDDLLPRLAAKYIFHLGEDSFYELYCSRSVPPYFRPFFI